MLKIPLTLLRNELADGLYTNQHREKIERLREVHHHSIRAASRQIPDLNCFAYAFGLTDEHARDLFSGTKIYCDARFVHWLRATHQLIPIEDFNDEPCIALYYFIDGATDRCKHAAIRRPDGRMISKWGTYHVYEHTLEEVPSNYGDDVILVKKPSEDQVHNLFKTYVQRCRQLPSWARPFGS
jgi:hypothetical protein